MNRAILWDFDGTLAHRPGMWRGCLIETLDEHQPGHGIEAETLRPFLRDGFPWHRAEVPHPELSEPGAWWRHVEPLLAAAYRGAGIDEQRADELASLARRRYVDPAIAWTLYPETARVLAELRGVGWRHLIVSNHVPELPDIVEALGLSPFLDAVLTSAATGFEKPHPGAFALARERAGAPGELWMVGDNPVADIAGAEAVGIPAVLVRTRNDAVRRSARDLDEAAAIIRLAVARRETR